MQDMRDMCEEKQAELKKVFKKGLSKRQKELMILAMEFGYASAFCARTCDMREMWFAGGSYTTDYEEFKKKLEVD